MEFLLNKSNIVRIIKSKYQSSFSISSYWREREREIASCLIIMYGYILVYFVLVGTIITGSNIKCGECFHMIHKVVSLCLLFYTCNL
jgi:hypothetical protein